MILGPEIIEHAIDQAVKEDVGRGDLTSNALIPKDAEYIGVIRARENMVIAGLPIAERVINKLAPKAIVTTLSSDGTRVAPGTELAKIKGPAQDLLAKYATSMGGAKNHRLRLDDGVLIKDNHLSVAGGVTEAVARARNAGLTDIEVECDTLEQVRESVEAGADSVLLDNMPPSVLVEAVAIVDRRLKTEASGGVTLKTIRAIARTGVDYISVGRITQSAPAIDIGLDWASE
jgi:nicotinate-nucleotide pyrophosphorylase (carboxylating)